MGGIGFFLLIVGVAGCVYTVSYWKKLNSGQPVPDPFDKIIPRAPAKPTVKK